ncbi:MAG: FeoA family protein [bacterium]
MTPLSELSPGQSGTIAGFRDYGPLVQRMMSLGVLEGNEVKVIRLAPAGDPIQVEVLGYSLSLRRSEAALIDIENVR